MKTVTLLHKQLRFKRKDRAKLFKSIIHSFGDRQKNVNSIAQKAHLNKYFFKDKEVDREMVLKYFQNENFKRKRSINPI